MLRAAECAVADADLAENDGTPRIYAEAVLRAVAADLRSPDELVELRYLFQLQWDRMAEATARWRAEDPDARALSMPDLGVLLKWLMDDADRAHRTTGSSPPKEA